MRISVNKRKEILNLIKYLERLQVNPEQNEPTVEFNQFIELKNQAWQRLIDIFNFDSKAYGCYPVIIEKSEPTEKTHFFKCEYKPFFKPAIPDYKKIYKDILNLKMALADLNFADAEKVYNGFNGDGELFDMNYKDFACTVNNNDGKPFLLDSFDIYLNGELYENSLTLNEIYERI